MKNRVVVLFALEREASPFQRLAQGLENVRIYISGVGRRRAGSTVEKILADPLSLIIAAGFCGALNPSLKVGDVVIATEVVDLAGRSWPVTGSRQPSGESVRRLLTVNHLVATVAEKQRLGASHHAEVVDMESALIADTCSARGVPFLIVRAVSDAVDTELSPELLRLLSGGRVSVWKALRALVRKPSLLGEFRRLARDTRLAARSLAETIMGIVRE